jgi:hypothetical protein
VAWPKLYPPGPVNSGESLQVWKVTLTTDAAGNATFEPAQDLYGKLYSIQVMETNSITGTYTLTVTSEYPYSMTVLSYDLSGGNSTQTPRSSTLLYPLAGDVKFTIARTTGAGNTGGNSSDFFAILTLEV